MTQISTVVEVMSVHWFQWRKSTKMDCSEWITWLLLLNIFSFLSLWNSNRSPLRDT